MKHNFEKFCKDYKNIENYEKALKDNFKGWNCHHRKGVDITTKELKTLGMYYDRPADELIFLKISEHSRLHNSSVESKKKKSEARKGKHLGKDNPFYGKHHTEEVRKKISEAQKGNKHALGCKRSEETRNKISEAAKGNTNAKGNTSVRGKRWFNNGKVSKRSYECPDGFVPGRIKKL